MSQVFGRSASLSDKIYDIQLLIPEWKVLFALNGEMDVEEISTFLETSADEVRTALDRLDELGLVILVNGTPEVEETKITEDLFLEETEEVTGELETSETPESDPLDDVLEELQFEEEIPEPEEMDTAESMSDERLDEVVSEVKKEVEEIPPLEEISAVEEVPAVEEPPVVEESPVAEEIPEAEESDDEDLDSLINDLLKEDSGDDEDFSDDLLSMPGDQVEPLDEITTPDTTDAVEDPIDDDFDLGDIFQSDLSQTEQSLEDVLESFEDETEEASAEVIDDVAPVAEPAGKKTVLVVDDSVVIRKMVEIALENENLNIISVANGKDALSFLDKEHTDIVILDIMLPDINGLDILKTIKSNKDLPVVMLSAKDTPRETTRAKELGADDFIPKPFKDEELINKIHELIGG